MVTCEDTQAARVLGHNLREPELRGKVRYRLRLVLVIECLLVPLGCGHVLAQLLVELLCFQDYAGICRQLLETLRRDLPEECHRIVVHSLPCIRRQRGEKLNGRIVPAPSQVPCQAVKDTQFRRKNRADCKSTYSFHRASLCHTTHFLASL